MKAIEWILAQLRSLGPYLAIELVLPGGSILALLLWAYRHRSAARQLATPIAKEEPGHAQFTRNTPAILNVTGSRNGAGAAMRSVRFPGREFASTSEVGEERARVRAGALCQGV